MWSTRREKSCASDRSKVSLGLTFVRVIELEGFDKVCAWVIDRSATARSLCIIEMTSASLRAPASYPRRRSLNSSAILLANHATPCRQAFGWMLLHPLGELRRAH